MTAVDAFLLPPILIDSGTPAAAAKVRAFYLSVAEYESDIFVVDLEW